jgi:hypothetical protein
LKQIENFITSLGFGHVEQYFNLPAEQDVVMQAVSAIETCWCSIRANKHLLSEMENTILLPRQPGTIILQSIENWLATNTKQNNFLWRKEFRVCLRQKNQSKSLIFTHIKSDADDWACQITISERLKPLEATSVWLEKRFKKV